MERSARANDACRKKAGVLRENPRIRRARLFLVALGLSGSLSGASLAGAPDLGWLDGDLGQVLHVRGMTFVSSEASSNEILVRSDVARFYPDRQVADLERVEVEVTPGDDRVGFEMRCDQGQLNLATQDFVAEGNVVGVIEGDREFEALWVAYDEAKGVLYTDEPVLIIDQDGRYRGGGFRYFVNEGRFRLEGGASVVREP